MINFGFIDLREISYKKFNIMSFVDLAIEGVLKHSRSYEIMEKIGRVYLKCINFKLNKQDKPI